MADDYKMFCGECKVLSEDCVGSTWRCYENEFIVAFIQKHWRCRENIKIVMAEDYSWIDYRTDDCKPETVPFWDKLIHLSDGRKWEDDEEEQQWQKEWKERVLR